MQLSDFDYHLPEELIAQVAIEPRDSAKMFFYDKNNNNKKHLIIRDLLDLLNENHVLVFNKSRVIPARIRFGGNKEVMLCKRFNLQNGTNDWNLQNGTNDGKNRTNICNTLNPFFQKGFDNYNSEVWEVLVRLGRKNKVGDIYQIDNEVGFKIIKVLEGGTRIVRFFNNLGLREIINPSFKPGSTRQNLTNDYLSLQKGFNFFSWLSRYGEMPLPPYIKGKSDSKRYQTTFSTEGDGMSVAAPTAGLHFTEELLNELRAKGVQVEFVHLDVGLGTFQPVKVENILDHKIHHESFSLDQDVADRLNEAKSQGKKIVAVGTTTIRVLETVAGFTGKQCNLKAFTGETNIFIYPGYEWKFVDEIITNFHLPKSSLLMLISSFIGREKVFELYKEAIEKRYRFYSFGDAMYLKKG